MIEKQKKQHENQVLFLKVGVSIFIPKSHCYIQQQKKGKEKKNINMMSLILEESRSSPVSNMSFPKQNKSDKITKKLKQKLVK